MILTKPTTGRRGHHLHRRTVLRGLGATVALPFLDAMSDPLTGTMSGFLSGAAATPAGRRRSRSSASAVGKNGFPRRFIVWYQPNGTVPHQFWPTGTEDQFTLSPILAPLSAHRDDLLIVRGIDMLSAQRGPGDAHQKGTGQCLTATELQEGDFPGDAGLSAGWADHISIDQLVAQHIGQDTLFSSLELGVAVQGSDVGARISYRAPGQPVPPENSPSAAFARLFGDAAADPAAVERRAVRRRAVLDQVAGEYRALHSQLGGADRTKLDAHMAAIGDIQRRLDRSVVRFEGACQPLDQGQPIDPSLYVHMPEIGRLHMDLVAMALACDVTRVASLMWTRSASYPVFGWLGEDMLEGHHAIAHKGDDDVAKVAQNTRIGAWYSEQLAYLIAALKAIPEGDGTVFDNTVILCTNEQSRGNNHDRREMPYILAGSAGGYFRTGRYVTLGAETGHNKL
ncbi:MAG: DUF1552 domain-containing protein, partial [Myxococcota bacterium]